MKQLQLTNTRVALDEYDRTQVYRDNMRDRVQSNKDVAAWEREETEALLKVRLAFYEDTKDRNSRNSCLLVGLDFIRRLVAKDAEHSIS